MSTLCNRCGTFNPPANNFCASCGGKMASTPPASNRNFWIGVLAIFGLGFILLIGAAIHSSRNQFAVGSKPNQNSQNGSTQAVSQGNCPPFELFIKTPEGGDLVPGVTLTRDGNGFINTKWHTTFPAGTKTMITLGQWKPNPKKDIPHGPQLAGSGLEGTLSDGKFIALTTPFTNEGASFGEGKYFLELTIIDNPIWKQPESTKAAIVSAKGKLKAVTEGSLGGKPFGTTFEVFARFDLPSCNSIPSNKPVPSEALAKAKQLSTGEASKEALIEASTLLRTIPDEAKEYKEAQRLLNKTIERSSRMMAEDLVLGPKPDNRGWKGKVFCVDRFLKASLNDYDSSEYLEWSPVTRVDVKGEPFWAVSLKLRATNGFGAKIIKEPTFYIRRDQVVSVTGL